MPYSYGEALFCAMSCLEAYTPQQQPWLTAPLSSSVLHRPLVQVAAPAGAAVLRARGERDQAGFPVAMRIVLQALQSGRCIRCPSLLWTAMAYRYLLQNSSRLRQAGRNGDPDHCFMADGDPDRCFMAEPWH
jgi:hypothetical protein